MAVDDKEREDYSTSATTPARSLPRFRIQNLMWVIALIAVGFALNRRLWVVPTLAILVFPLSLLVERFFGAKPSITPTRWSLSGFALRVAAVVACGCLCAIVARHGSSQRAPTLLSPLPFFAWVILARREMVASEFWMSASALAFGSFLLMNSYQFRISGQPMLSARFPILLVTATGFSVFWFAGGWPPGLRYQEAYYVGVIAVINLSFLLVFWGWWLAIRRRTSTAGALTFATVLHCWLFWFAFPRPGDT